MMRQGKRPVEDYISEFKRWAPDSLWNDVCLRNQFRIGLSEAIKDDLARTEVPQTLEGVMQLAITLERRLQERRLERAYTVSIPPPTTRPVVSTTEPMEIGTIRGPLSTTERTRRRTHNLCMYCASADHVVNTCPLVRRKTLGESLFLRNLTPPHIKQKHLKLLFTLQWDQNQTSLEAMIDTGACGSFIDETIVTRLNIPTRIKERPFPVKVIDGSPLASSPVSSETIPLLVSAQHEHFEFCSFDIISSPHFPIVLGLPWLLLHKPTVNWHTLSVEFTSPYCASTCLRSHSITCLSQTPSLPLPYQDFADVFCPKLAETLPPHRPYDCPIDLLPNSKIPFGHVYSLSQPELQHLRTYLDENVRKGFIRPSTSPAGAGMFFVTNKDGSLRPIIDYRELNKVTIKNRYPLPLIPDLIERLRTATVFTKLDLKGAYNLVRIRAGDEWKTAFRTRYGLYEYLVMPFGLANAPATFQFFVNDIFHDLLDICVVVYLDDILIYSENLDSHRKHVRWVLSRLRTHNLYAKMEKCSFETTSVTFLGYIISPEGVKMDNRKVECIQNWPQPTTRKGVQKFLGFANFYRKFIRNFSALAKPLTQLTSSKTPFRWGSAPQKAFDSLKTKFTTAPILRLPNPNLQFVLEVDASNHAVGAVLSQKPDSLSPLHPVGFFSKSLSSSEINYSIGEKELLAIKLAFQNWRHLLEGSFLPIVVYTDHNNLQFIQRCKTLSARQMRWLIFFERFNFTITYRAGSRNGKADALSRLLEPEVEVFDPRPIVPPERIVAVLTQFEQQVLDEYPLDSAAGTYDCGSDGLPRNNGRLYVPISLREEALRTVHDTLLAGHQGIRRTLDLLQRSYWWPTMRQDVQSYVSTCETCARSKPDSGRPSGFLLPLPIPDRPWQALSMDFIVDLPVSFGYTTILVVVDVLTKMCHFIPVKQLPTSKETADLLFDNVFRLHGLPSSIVSDRGTQFTSKFWRAVCSKLQIDLRLSTSFHPQTNGQTERLNRTLEQYLRCFCTYQQDDWSRLLSMAEFALNNSHSSTTGYSPFFSNYGFHPSFLPLSDTSTTNPASQSYLTCIAETHSYLQTNIAAAQRRQSRDYNRRRRKAPSYSVGDLVWLSTRHLRVRVPSRKLAGLYTGPFPIVGVVNENAVRLRLPPSLPVHPTFHVSLLKPYTPNSFPGRVVQPVPPLQVDGQEEFEVLDIVDSRRFRGALQYLVRWKGYGPQDDSWESAADVHAPVLCRRFHDRYPSKPGPHRPPGIGPPGGAVCRAHQVPSRTLRRRQLVSSPAARRTPFRTQRRQSGMTSTAPRPRRGLSS